MRSFGSHVFDFLFCPDKRLNSTFKNKDAIKCGLTRLECTINGGRIPKEKELNNIIGNMYDIVNIPIFYEVPFKCQFKALTEKIDKNLIFYNKTEDKLYVTYWANTLTRKITGGCIKMSKYTKTGEKERVINYVLSHYSMQLLPCYYVELEKNKDAPKEHGEPQVRDEINIKTVEIKKEYGPTQIVKSGYLFTSTPKPKKSKHIIKEEEIEEMGIEDDDLIEKEQDIEIDYEIPDIKQYIKDAGYTDNVGDFADKILTFRSTN